MSKFHLMSVCNFVFGIILSTHANSMELSEKFTAIDDFWEKGQFVFRCGPRYFKVSKQIGAGTPDLFIKQDINWHQIKLEQRSDAGVGFSVAANFPIDKSYSLGEINTSPPVGIDLFWYFNPKFSITALHPVSIHGAVKIDFISGQLTEEVIKPKSFDASVEYIGVAENMDAKLSQLSNLERKVVSTLDNIIENANKYSDFPQLPQAENSSLNPDLILKELSSLLQTLPSEIDRNMMNEVRALGTAYWRERGISEQTKSWISLLKWKDGMQRKIYLEDIRAMKTQIVAVIHLLIAQIRYHRGNVTKNRLFQAKFKKLNLENGILFPTYGTILRGKAVHTCNLL